MYLPPYDYVLTGICGDDTLRVWGMGVLAPRDSSPTPTDAADLSSSTTFNRRFDVLAMRDLFLKRNRAVPITMNLKRTSSSENVIEGLKKNYTGGYLTALACSADTRLVVATLDSSLVLLSANDGEFSVDRVLRLANEVYVTQVDFLFSELSPSSSAAAEEGLLVLCRTNVGDLLLLDLMAGIDGNEETKTKGAASRETKPPPLLVVEGGCLEFVCSSNCKLFAVHRNMGEIDWYSLEFLRRKMETELSKRDAALAMRGTTSKLPPRDLENVQREVSGI